MFKNQKNALLPQVIAAKVCALSILNSFSSLRSQLNPITIVRHSGKLPSRRGHFSFSLDRPSLSLLIRLTKPRPNMFHRYTLYIRLLLKYEKVHTYLHDTEQCEEPIAEWEALEAAPAWEHKVLIRASELASFKSVYNERDTAL